MVLGIACANLVCGLTGSMPATAALARTALNIKSGAKSRMSAIIGCISVIIISMLILDAFNYIPLPTIAALLVMVAIRMVDWSKFPNMWHYSKKAFWISMFTCALCIFLDTIVGLVAGSVIAILLFADQLQDGHHDFYRYNGAGYLFL